MDTNCKYSRIKRRGGKKSFSWWEMIKSSKRGKSGATSRRRRLLSSISLFERRLPFASRERELTGNAQMHTWRKRTRSRARFLGRAYFSRRRALSSRRINKNEDKCEFLCWFYSALCFDKGVICLIFKDIQNQNLFKTNRSKNIIWQNEFFYQVSFNI